MVVQKRAAMGEEAKMGVFSRVQRVTSPSLGRAARQEEEVRRKRVLLDRQRRYKVRAFPFFFPPHPFPLFLTPSLTQASYFVPAFGSSVFLWC